MKQRQTAAPGQPVTITETIKTATGALDDLSAKEVVVNLYSPSGTKSAMSASGSSLGVITATATLSQETGEHKAFGFVDGALKFQRGIVARGRII